MRRTGNIVRIVRVLILGALLLLLLWLMGIAQNYLVAYIVGTLVIAGLMGVSAWWSVVLTAHTLPKKGESQVHADRTFAPGSHRLGELGMHSYFHKHHIVRDILCILSKRPL
jgi:hypothetical protein